MHKHTWVVLVCLILLSLSTVVWAEDGATAGNPTMSDSVPLDHWAYDAVRKVEAAGIIIGYPDDTKLWSRPMTRYEFAMAISRMLDALRIQGILRRGSRAYWACWTCRTCRTCGARDRWRDRCNRSPGPPGPRTSRAPRTGTGHQ